MVNHDDQKTMALFGDAATASLVSCGQRPGNIGVKLNRPFLSAAGVEEKVLYVPNMASGEVIEMEGLTVFKLAVRKMIDMLDNACGERGITVDDLSYIVPHQANERIIEAIRKTIHCPPGKMFNHIRKFGNTSSNTGHPHRPDRLRRRLYLRRSRYRKSLAAPVSCRAETCSRARLTNRATGSIHPAEISRCWLSG
jgi:hypothetical protein